ncbi:MAG: Sulfite reductase [NADPH] flavoprotein alpha-component [Chlamydiae bacterium]|nr:Sulfite reductase [NADPH] flavoprotein alpha-component [Chlamydiota bacterium]
MTFDRNNPFLATITEREILNKPGSEKCTVHVSLDISDSHISYKVGDSVAVFPTNSPIIVDEILRALKADANTKIVDPRTSNEMSLQDFLVKRANLAKVTKKWIQYVSMHVTEHHEKEALKSLLESENKEKLKDFCSQRQLWDFLKEFSSLEADINECLPIFALLLPRFYSIASSQKKDSNKIDLLIAYFKYTSNKHLRHGVASHYLCELAPMNSPEIAMYIHPSKDFTLPSDPNTPIIMIGPGTGIAPYRGFMQERLASNASGKNWLFFGDWHRANDFYYSEYWQELEKEKLIRLSLAFSRDCEHKIYVQHKMFEEAQEFWEWLEKGAVVYVCGDASNMAKDVDLALHKIVEEQGHKTPEEAKVYVKEMKGAQRYLRDVY